MWVLSPRQQLTTAVHEDDSFSNNNSYNNNYSKLPLIRRLSMASLKINSLHSFTKNLIGGSVKKGENDGSWCLLWRLPSYMLSSFECVYDDSVYDGSLCPIEVAIVGCCAVHAIFTHTSVWHQCIRLQFDKGCLYTHCCHTCWRHTHIQRQQTEALPSSTLLSSMPLLAISIFFKSSSCCHLLPFLHSPYWGLARLVSDRFLNSGTRLFYSTRNLSKKLINITDGRTSCLRILGSALNYFLSSRLTSDLWIQKTTCWIIL